MAFEGLTEQLSNAFKRLRGKGRLTEADVKEAMREIRMALLEADVVTGSRNRRRLAEALDRFLATGERLVEISPHQRGEERRGRPP